MTDRRVVSEAELTEECGASWMSGFLWGVMAAMAAFVVLSLLVYLP